MKNLKIITYLVLAISTTAWGLENTPTKPTAPSEPALSSPEKPRPAKRRLFTEVSSDIPTEPNLTSSEVEMLNPAVVRIKMVNQTNKPVLLVYHTVQGVASKLLARMGKNNFYSNAMMHLHKGPITVSMNDGNFYQLTYDAAKNALDVNRVFSEDPVDSTPMGNLALPRNKPNLVLLIKWVRGQEEIPFSITPE